MKYVKILGLAVVAAAALMAIAGAGTASATTLCTTVEPTPCETGWTYTTGTTIESKLVAGTKAVLKAGIEDVCEESTVKGSTSNENAAKIEGGITTLDWGKCSCATTETLKNGSLAIEQIAGTMNGTLSGSGSEVKVVCAGVECRYGTAATGTHIGKVTGGTPAKLKAEATLPKLGGGFLCASTGTWTAEYEVTKPATLWISS